MLFGYYASSEGYKSVIEIIGKVFKVIAHKRGVKMEISEAVEKFMQILVPVLPYLIKGGKEVGRGAATKLGENLSDELSEKLRSIWKRLQKHKPIDDSAGVLAKKPTDGDALATLHMQISKVLSENQKINKEIVTFLSKSSIYGLVQVNTVNEAGEVVGVNANKSKDTNIIGKVIAGDVSGKATGVSIDEIGK